MARGPERPAATVGHPPLVNYYNSNGQWAVQLAGQDGSEFRPQWRGDQLEFPTVGTEAFLHTFYTNSIFCVAFGVQGHPATMIGDLEDRVLIGNIKFYSAVALPECRCTLARPS